MAIPAAPFNVAHSLYSGLNIVQLKLLPQLTGITAATTVLTKNAHGLLAGQVLQFVSGTGFTGLTAGVNYGVRDVTTNTFGLGVIAADGTIGAAIAVGTSTVGVFSPVSIFAMSSLEHKDDSEYKYLPFPDASGVMRDTRSVRVKGGESWTGPTPEPKRLVSELFGGALAGKVDGTCTIWMPDPQDAANVVALKSENDFACTVMRDGSLKTGDGDFTKANLVIKSLKVTGSVTFARDGAA